MGPTADTEKTVASVVIPVKNEAAHLRETLASIAAIETDAEHEVIVVDDNSRDELATSPASTMRPYSPTTDRASQKREISVQSARREPGSRSSMRTRECGRTICPECESSSKRTTCQPRAPPAE